MQVIDANDFLFFVNMLKPVLENLEKGISATQFTHGRDHVVVEFEVCIKRLNGKPLPRVTERSALAEQRREQLRVQRATTPKRSKK